MGDLTHDDLVWIAALWLQRNRCPVVITELVSSGMEIPDAMGFSHAGISTLIECKASRSDFLSDRKKQFRRFPENGLGRYRYYMAPKGLISPDELKDGWGLITVNENRHTRRVAKAEFQEMQEFTQRREIKILVSALRRLAGHVKGVNVKFYEYGAMTKATIGVEPI